MLLAKIITWSHILSSLFLIFNWALPKTIIRWSFFVFLWIPIFELIGIWNWDMSQGESKLGFLDNAILNHN